ncbi:MAG: dTDP-4-dehydrorhamnose 3,5-epimerase [Bacteroidota bacterium]
MEFTRIAIEGVIVIQPALYSDERGSFLESFNKREWGESGIYADFVQDNQSISRKGVIRGLHFQRAPHEQGKLVRVVAGSAMDVLVDLRRDSPTFGRHLCVDLSAENNRMLWIPPGFAHGFESLEDNTVFLYKVSHYYNPQSEGGIRFDDPSLSIPWRTSEPVVSHKDRLLPTLGEWMASI